MHPAPAIVSQPTAESLTTRTARMALHGLWLVVVPALLAALAVRYFVPTPAEAKGTWAERLAALGDDHVLGVSVVLFLLFAALVQHWAERLPGGRYLAPSEAIALKSGERRAISGWVAAVAIGAVAAFALRSLAGSYRVLSGSMLPSLEPGDLVVGSKLAYRKGGSGTSGPARGDIIVFRKPAGVEGPDQLIKRVIGLPGDRIGMHGAHAVINGWEVPSCDAGGYLYPFSGGGASGRVHLEFLDDHTYLTLVAPARDQWTDPYEVKAGEVFVLGDNRNNSSDSRSWNEGRGGGLPLGEIEARAARRLVGVLRNQHVDLDDALKPLDLHLRLEGVDTSELREGIESCLRNRPAITHPPAPINVSASAGSNGERG